MVNSFYTVALMLVPAGKYNKWCERRLLVCSDEGKSERANKYVEDDTLTLSEKAAFYTHELVDCQGLEFVVFSNARMDLPVELPGNITLVPCFVAKSQGADSTIAQLTLEMARKACFVYDGWLPITDWQLDDVRKAVRKINSALSVFALRASAWFSWEPKYSPIMRGGSYYNFRSKDIAQVNELSKSISRMNEPDAQAFLSSIGWFSQCVRSNEPAARFLFGILAIESLAMYIEEESAETSVFSKLRSEQLTGQQRKEWRQTCIRDKMAELLDEDPEKAARDAYFDCIVGIKRRLESHLTNVFCDESEPVELLFKLKVEGRTLYELRHWIAHGRMDALSETQREAIIARAWDVERVAREYTLKVLGIVMAREIDDFEISESIAFRLQDGVATREGMYRGPVHMAEVYSSIYGDSIGLPKASNNRSE
jgi:hypothetical protein